MFSSRSLWCNCWHHDGRLLGSEWERYPKTQNTQTIVIHSCLSCSKHVWNRGQTTILHVSVKSKALTFYVALLLSLSKVLWDVLKHFIQGHFVRRLAWKDCQWSEKLAVYLMYCRIDGKLLKFLYRFINFKTLSSEGLWQLFKSWQNSWLIRKHDQFAGVYMSSSLLFCTWW